MCFFADVPERGSGPAPLRQTLYAMQNAANGQSSSAQMTLSWALLFNPRTAAVSASNPSALYHISTLFSTLSIVTRPFATNFIADANQLNRRIDTIHTGNGIVVRSPVAIGA
jgi:hypothetical protein